MPHENVTLSARQINADRPRVRDFCARTIIEAAEQFAGDAASAASRGGVDALGDGGKMNEWDLHLAAVALTLRLIELRDTGGEEGAYLAEQEAPNLAPHVLLRMRQSRRARGRALAHELPHHLMRTRVAMEMYGAETVLCHELDGPLVRHQIAESVARMISAHDDRR